MEDITTDTTEIQRIVKACYEQFYANKLDNLEEVDKSLETYNPPWPNHEEIEHWNRSITSKETESEIKNLPTNKSQGADGFTMNLPNNQGELIPIFLKLFHKTEEKETAPN